MTKRTISPEPLGPARGYSHGIQAGDLVFVAGQIGGLPREDGRHDMVEGGLVPQFQKALDNVVTVVEEAGGTAQDIVDMTIFVTHMEAYRDQRKELGQAWQATMGKRYPAMALVGVDELFEPEAMVEIQATAAIEQEAHP